MTDRGESALLQSPHSLTVGPSALKWRGGRLVIDIDEISALPIISRVRGRITLTPTAVTEVELPLTPDGSHIWRPFAPTCSIEVDLDAKSWRWQGQGYFDANFGTRALEQDFDYWTWGRFPTGQGSTCFYDALRRDGSTLSAALRFDSDGSAYRIPAPPKAALPRSLWQVRRETRADPGHRPQQVQSMLDAPFYCRSAVRTCLHAEVTTGVHEALDLTRFRLAALKPMLAMRVPRRAHWAFQ